MAYLNLCFLRKQQEKMPPKGKIREMETLAHIMDAAAEGDIGGVMDIAFGRFQALEVSHEDGWGTAEHIEVAPRMELSATSEGERTAAAKLEEAKQKREKLIQKVAGGGTEGGGGGGGRSPPKKPGRFQFQYRAPWQRSWKGQGGKGKGRGKKGK